jgi:hypothetical protein
MANLTSDRDTEFVEKLAHNQLPMDAVKLCNGCAVAVTGNGFATHAGPGVRHLQGIAAETVDNSQGHAGDQTIDLDTPDAAYWDNDGSITVDTVGGAVYFADDHTVTRTVGTNTYAGRVRSCDQYGALVDMRGAYADLAVPVTTAPTLAPTTAG